MIYNFGSLNIDYVYNVEHFVKPGETISSDKMQVFAGGKGLNQSVALARAGAKVMHCAFVSKNDELLIQTLQSSGVDTSLIKHINAPNGHAIIQVDKHGQNCILLFGGTNHDINMEYVNFVSDKIKKGDIVLFQNETSMIREMMLKCKQKGADIILNPSPMNEQCLQLPLDIVDIFILNEIEAYEISGKNNPDDFLHYMKKKFPNAKIILTLGKNGAIYYDGTNTYTQKAIGNDVVDTTAAGDTFTGYFLSKHAQQLPGEIILKYAATAAGISISRHGASVSIPTLCEVEKLLVI